MKKIVQILSDCLCALPMDNAPKFIHDDGRGFEKEA